MNPTLEPYEEQTSLPFTSAELGAFHRFHSYHWDDDKEFQAGLRTITQAQSSKPSFSELLKMKQYYFSTRVNVKINLDDYLSWRKHLEPLSDDPNVPIFRRFDGYDFDNDIKFQEGLPGFIGQLIKDGKSSLSKADLQKEMTKAKAFYYARFIELFDFPAYLVWKDMEKSQAGPACPYAHLWQNKGKGSGNDLEENTRQFVTTTSPTSSGALLLHVHSPATRNTFSGVRMAKMSEAISAANKDSTITSVLWTVNTGKSTQDQRDPESEIVTRDEKWFSGGVINGAHPTQPSKQDPTKSQELLRQYYSLVDEVSRLTSEQQKPVVVVVDGIVSLSAAYLAFGSEALCVITENATLSFTPLDTLEQTPGQVETPFAGLYLLARIQSHARVDTSARPLPKGVGHYLAFCPDYLLRGPDLRKLGLADFFVSSSKKKDIEEAVLSVAGCPPPHTTQAIRMALNAEVVYPGPAKIDVWRSEIQECFGDARSIDDIVVNLEKYDNSWSKSIRAYISSLDPLFAKLLFRAISVSTELGTFKDCIRLEHNLTQKYKEYLASSAGTEETTDVADVDQFFDLSKVKDSELFDFPFKQWLRDNRSDEDIGGIVHMDITAETHDPAKACPYFANKSPVSNESTLPSDHPNIPGVDFSDPEAMNACPFLSVKSAQKETSTPSETVPADHPKIPGVDFTNPDAAKACPFLSSRSVGESVDNGRNAL
ncbi:hypothetical protein KVV02_000043 [Mortierella alpina]|uniref:3-hydroxyisobutyryl-coenzyme A hydrolase n=1 Tax=Mortierella alpina TaxID=64518 RepID=A0A9P8A7U0_MORAP|nr:hypothetical protein KVV02_000043 [Mortierella alpina]